PEFAPLRLDGYGRAHRGRGRRPEMSWSVGAGLEGKGVIVTGAAGGIGKAVAEAFATAGARVMVVDLDEKAVESVRAGLPGKGHAAAAVDLRDLKAQAALIERTRQEFGNLYVLAGPLDQ